MALDGETLAVHDTKIESLEKSDVDQWSHITSVENALRSLVPIWVTIVLTSAGFITGSALTFAGMIIKFAGNLK